MLNRLLLMEVYIFFLRNYTRIFCIKLFHVLSERAPLVIPLPSTALTSSSRLPRPSTFVCLVCHSLIMCHKLIRPDLGALKCCQKLKCCQDEGSTKMTSLRLPSGWFCNYAHSDDHLCGKDPSVIILFIKHSIGLYVLSNISKHDLTVKRILFNICVFFRQFY